MELTGKKMTVSKKYLAVDIGGSYIKYGTLNDKLEIEDRFLKKTIYFENIKAFLDYLLGDIDSTYDAICVSSPGIIKDNAVIASNPGKNLAILHKINLKEEISQRQNCPVFIENDAIAAAKCEVTCGVAQKASSFVMFIIGTGIGGAVYLNKQLYRGSNQIVGEFSAIPIGYTDECNMLRLGTVCSINQLFEYYNSQSNTPVYDAQTLIELVKKADVIAINTLDRWCQNIVLAISIVSVCYNPEMICLSGGITASDYFCELLIDKYQKTATPFKGRNKTRICFSRFHNESNLIGSVLLYKEHTDENNNRFH